MKKIKIFKSGFCEKLKLLLIPIGLLIGSVTSQVWAGNSCDFYGTPYIKLWVNSSKTVQMDLAHSGVSDLELGVVDALYLSEICSQTWRYDNGNVCSVKMCWGVNSSRDGSKGSTYEVGHDDYYTDWWNRCSDCADKDKFIQQWKRQPNGLNLLDGLTPGQDYYLDFYLHIYGNNGGSSGCYDNQKYRNNNGGNYHVHFRVADSKSTFTAGSYLYFDARTLTSWQINNPDIQFFFKEYYYGNTDISDVKCLKTNALEDWVYYVTVPEGERNGTVEIDRVRPAGSSDENEYWNKTNYMYACDRDDANQNCLVGDGSDKWSSWSPTWSTYCPPKATSTINDNGTVKTWGGSGTSGSPYYVATGSSIKVSAASTNTLTDANMTTKYDFQVRNTSNVQQAHSDGTATTYSYTVPATNNVTYKVRVNAYNSYNSASSTDKWSDASEIYYTARTPYNIAYNKGSYGTGDNVTDVKLNAINITLRGVTFTRTGYTQTAWNTNSAGTGGTSYDLSETYTGNAALILYPTWTANEITVTLDKGDHGTADQEMKINYDAAGYTSFTRVAATGYNIEGYYYGALKVLNADGTFAASNVSGFITEGQWTKADNCTLTAHFTIKTYNGTIDKTTGTADGSYSVTYLADEIVVAVGNEPVKAGYHVTGYYLSYSEGVCDIQIANASHKLQASRSYDEKTYTNVSSQWIYDGTAPTIYAQWAENTITINLDDNKGGDTSGDAGSTSRNVTMNHNDYTDITPPTRKGYTFTGYYLAADGDDQVFTGADAPVANVTSHTDGKGNWIQASTVTLYAHWEANEYTINLHSRYGTGAPSTVTATYDSDDLSELPVSTKWGNTFGGWWTNSNGTGTEVITSAGALKTSVSGYTDGSGNWIHDGAVDLYAKWTPKANLYWISGDGEGYSSGTAFTSAGDNKYYVKVDLSKDDKFHLGDGDAVGGPSSNTTFTLATSEQSVGANAKYFQYDGTQKQTFIFVLDIYTLKLSFENFVIYKSSSDKSDDTHTAYGSVAGYSGTIFGDFELRLPVTGINKWSTLCLPFKPTKVQAWGGSVYHDLYPCHRKADGYLYQGYYVIRTPEKTTDLPIDDFKQWNDPDDYMESEKYWTPAANTPYIIQWQNSWFMGRYISFWGNDETISASFLAGAAPTKDGVVNVLGNATMGSGSVKGAYVLADEYGDGAWLRDEDVDKSSAVGPFECYIRANAATTGSHLVIKRRTGEETPTGWEDVMNSERKAQVVVYTITGLRVTEYNDCSFDEAGRRLSETYNEGIFIMRAGDESVKLMLR